MSYELTITPNRGAFSLVTSGPPVSGLTVPDNYSGLRSASFSMDRVPGLTVNGSPGAGAITFNNASFSNVTSINVTTTGSGTAPFYSVGGYIQVFNMANFEQFALFEVTSTSLSQDFQTRTLGVTYISSSVSSLANGVLVAAPQLFPSTSIEYVALPNSPLTVTGSLRAINGILQTPLLAGWTEFVNDYDIEAVGGVNFLINLRKTPENTADVQITYAVTKNGVAHQTFDVSLQYKSAAQIRNPGGLPS